MARPLHCLTRRRRFVQHWRDIHTIHRGGRNRDPEHRGRIRRSEPSDGRSALRQRFRTTSSILVTPSSLTLPGALLTTTSSGSVSITNTGNTPLSIASIGIAPGLFTETSMTAPCNNGAFPIVIAPGGPACVVTVTFAPLAATAPGPVPGSLTITQTGGSVTTVPLSGPAWDFSVSAANHHRGTWRNRRVPVVVTGLGGFTGEVSFTCTPAMLITSCSVPTTNAAPAPGATANGSITAASFIVPPQSLKAPPSALLRQVLFIMMAMILLFMLPVVRRFRTRLGMAGAMMVFVVVAGCCGSRRGIEGINHSNHAVLRNCHQGRDHRQRNHHAIKLNPTAVQAARRAIQGARPFFAHPHLRCEPASMRPSPPPRHSSVSDPTSLRFQIIFRRALHFAGLSIYPSEPPRANVLSAARI